MSDGETTPTIDIDIDIDLDRAIAAEAEVLSALISPAARTDPYPLYAELRTASPILPAGEGFWLISRHADVRRVLRDPRFSSDESRSRFNRAQTAQHGGQSPDAIDQLDLMLFMDPPDHTRLRRLVAGSFTPRRVAALTPRVGEIVGRILGNRDPDDGLDVVSDLAHPLATQVICELLGVPLADRPRFATWSTAMARAIDPSAIRPPEADVAIAAAIEAFRDYFDGLVADRRHRPGDDLLSALVEAEADGDRLSHDELLATGVLLLIAGYETTINLIGNGTLALIGDPPTMERWRRDPALGPTAVDELLRFDAPVQMTQRIALEDVELAGQTVPAGAALVLLLGAANRDPAAFDRPDHLMIDRTDNPHVAFGGGIHHCLGAALARTEGEVAISALLGWADSLELAEEPVRRPTLTLRGLDRLLVSGA